MPANTKPVVVPEAGLALVRSANATAGPPTHKPTQVIKITFADNTVKELVKSTRNGGKGAKLSFGKTPTLYYGNKTKRLTSKREPATHELYRASPGYKNKLALAGVVSHKLEALKAEKTIVRTDAALLALQNTLAAHNKQKESKKTLLVDSSKLPPAKGAKRPAAKTKPSLPFLKNNRSRIFSNGTTRSVPTSPPVGISTAPTRLTSALPPTSAPAQPDQQSAKLEALRTPLIHLLAIRPVSEKFLAQKTRSSAKECLGLLQKVGRPWRLDASKWELSDRGYKTLDLWKFRYPSQDDRQMAIDNAVKAFDRLRLSRSDKLWDSLLPVKERNKGKCISRLNLHSGPIQRSATPLINVQQHKEGTVSGSSTSNESDGRKGALVPHGGETMVRSKSQDPIKKTKISEREAQSKRLLSKDPKRATLASKAKDRKPAPKKDASNTNANTKVKSAEFVRDSDEESSPMDGVVYTGKPPQPQKPLQKAKPANSVTIPPRKTTTSTAPQKPSPLGCSPPTNASDFENEVGSSSSTTTAATNTTAATTSTSATVITITTTQRSQGPPLKRKADALGGNAEAITMASNKRHQASSPAITPPSSESSGGSRTPSQEVLLLARRFKSYYAKYEKLYREVASSPSSPPEQVKKVMDMHNRLAAMKAEIERAAA